MNNNTRQHFNNLQLTDAHKRAAAFMALMKITDEPVDWTYEVWDELMFLLQKGDNHQRAIGAQLLANLAKSDPEQRLATQMGKLFKATHDEKFVTARHSLQGLWRVGIVDPLMSKKTVDGLSKRFRECIDEKNCTLIRYDIMEVLRKMYNHTQDEKIKLVAEKLMATEEEEKYRKKYRGIWKDVLKK